MNLLKVRMRMLLAIVVSALLMLQGFHFRPTSNLTAEDIWLHEHNDESHMPAWLSLAGDGVMRPVPKLNVTLHIAGVRIVQWPGKPLGLQFLAMVEDNDGRLIDDGVQMSPSQMSADLSISASFNGVDVPCELQTVHLVNDLWCPIPDGVRFPSGGEIMPIVLHDRARDIALPVPVQRVTGSRYHMTLCVAFISNARPVVLTEFIAYHSLLGVDHFVFYDRTGQSTLFLRRLAQDFNKRNVTVEVIWWPGATVDIQHIYRANNFYDQVVALNHCLFRNSARTRWMGHWDLDEFFYSHSPEHRNIPQWLDRTIVLEGRWRGCSSKGWGGPELTVQDEHAAFL